MTLPSQIKEPRSDAMEFSDVTLSNITVYCEPDKYDHDCSKHYVVFFMSPRHGVVSLFDSLDTPKDRFKDFVTILKK